MNQYRISLQILLLCLILGGCALIDISETRVQHVIHYTQDSPEGVVHLFMLELDSNNAKGAVVLLADNSGTTLSAERKLELYPEMQRLRRVMKFEPITMVKSDTLTPTLITVTMEVDYYKNYVFSTQKINDNWYITDYSMK